MNATSDADAVLALRDLVYRYASALDRRDGDALLTVFWPDAVVRVFPPGADEPMGETRGHDQIQMMAPGMAARFAQTMHVISNPVCTVDGDAATGSAYCVAHHLILDDPSPRTFVVHLRYDDEFRRDDRDEWRIVHRDIRFLWTAEGPPPLAWETAVERGRLG